MTIEERGRDEIDAPSVDGYPMIDGELDPQIADLRRELLEQKANTTWVPEEDPYVVCIRIAREVGQFYVERGVDPKDLGEYEFNSLRDLLRQNWDFLTNHREFVEEVASDELLRHNGGRWPGGCGYAARAPVRWRRCTGFRWRASCGGNRRAGSGW